MKCWLKRLPSVNLLNNSTPAGKRRQWLRLASPLPINELHDGRTAPQRKFHLQLLGTLVAADLADRVLLLFAQHTSFARPLATYFRLDRGESDL